MTWNIEGLRSAILKSPENDPFRNSDIVCLQETFVDEVNDNLRSLLPAYKWELSPAFAVGTKLRQGICILTKQHIKVTILGKSNYHLAINIGLLNIVSFYFPPSTEVADVVLEISNVLSQISHNQSTLLCGDFNCRTDEGKRGVELLATLKNFGFLCCNDINIPTYISPNGNSSVDLVLNNLVFPEKMTKVSILPTTERKHQRVTCEIFLPGEIQHYQQPSKPLPRKIDSTSLISHLTVLPSPDLFHQINGNVHQLTRTVTDIIIGAVPQPAKGNNHHKRWFDSKCLKLKKKTLSLKHQAAITGDYSEYRISQQKYKYLVKEKKEKHDKTELLKRIEDSETSPWLLFKVRSPSLPSPIDVNIWQQRFSNLYNPNNQLPGIPDLDELVSSEERYDNLWYNSPFTETEVSHTIIKSSMKKAPGPDKICYEHLKLSLSFLLPVLTWLFNLCLFEMNLPETWRSCLLKTLYKNKGERIDPNNYRGIALLNTLFKVLTGMINQRLRTVSLSVCG